MGSHNPRPQILQSDDIALASPPGLDGKTLLLMAPHIRVLEHGDTKSLWYGSFIPTC